MAESVWPTAGRTPDQDPNAVYALGSSPGESARLQRQADELDADPAHTAMAAEFAARRGLSGVEIITADAECTGLPAASFDLVHTRTLLVNLPDPAAVAAEMARLAKTR